MNYTDDLEWWCIRAAQWMQEVIDDAQAATGRHEDETECTDGRELLRELDKLIADTDGGVDDPNHWEPRKGGLGV